VNESDAVCGQSTRQIEAYVTEIQVAEYARDDRGIKGKLGALRNNNYLVVEAEPKR
jgi:hypothetical protein